MTDLKNRITEDVKTAMRAGDKLRVSVLRMLTAEMKQREVVDAVELTEAVIMASIEKMVKQRRDSEKQYREYNRPELADKETAEIKILPGYMPPQLPQADLHPLSPQAIPETGTPAGQ